MMSTYDPWVWVDHWYAWYNTETGEISYEVGPYYDDDDDGWREYDYDDIY